MSNPPKSDLDAEPERPAPAEPAASRVPRSRSAPKGRLLSGCVAVGSLAAVIVAFSGAWAHGALLVDGPGIAMYVQVVLDHLSANGRPLYWVSEMWAGTPVWAIGPSFPVLLLVPIAAVVGSVTAVKAGILGLQVAGAWGAYVLARSLWDHFPAALVAGLVYALNPVVISHGALAGSESSIGVIAATPWLVWSLRRGLRGDGTRYLVVAGLTLAFAVLHQAEYAYGLALLFLCMVALEAGRIRQGRAHAGIGTLLGRAGLVGVLSLGAVAHWLLPFLALHEWFVLSPPALVQGELLHGIGDVVGRELGVFLNRSTLHGVVTGDRAGLIEHVLYLGWVPVAITIVTSVLVARRDGDRTLSAALLVSVITVWMSTGAATLATGGPVARGQVLPLVVTGLVGGLITGGFLRRIGLGRVRTPVAVVVGASFFAAPYLSPLVLLQQAVPFLSSIRFPRFYVFAVLGLALGTAWPIAHFGDWRPVSRQRHAGVAVGAVALAVAGAVLVDVWPFRSFYRLKAPAQAAAYRQASATLPSRPPGSRVATESLDPRISTSLLRMGADLSLGWPHPVAGVRVWRLTVDALLAPAGYAYRALGLSSTSYVLGERPAAWGTAEESVAEVQLLANPRNLPLVRAYDHTVVAGDRTIAPELAVATAHRNVAVVTGGAAARRAVAGTVRAPTVPTRPCDDPSLTDLPVPLAGEVGIACGMRRWLPTMLSGTELFGVDRTPGAIFVSPVGGLRGVSVWFHDPPGQSEVVLHEVGPDGRSVGREVTRAKASGTDEYGMTVFAFDALADSAGKRYLFEIHFQCPDCYSELAPQMLVGTDPGGDGNLLFNRRLDGSHLAAFAPVYERLQPAPPSSTRVDGRRLAPGRWRVQTSGSRPSLVVVAEAYFPGWRASVDGRPAPVVEADGAFLGVPVGAGDHEITLQYHAPAAATVGRIITALTLVAILAAGLRSRRRSRRDALEVSAPPGQPPGKELLGAGESGPRPAVADRKSPGAEGQEAVLATVDDSQADGLDHGRQGGRAEA